MNTLLIIRAILIPPATIAAFSGMVWSVGHIPDDWIGSALVLIIWAICSFCIYQFGEWLS